jgi:hypothetical protein
VAEGVKAVLDKEVITTSASAAWPLIRIAIGSAATRCSHRGSVAGRTNNCALAPGVESRIEVAVIA